ncbi:MAG: hypothetical protein JWR09_65 [Mucilaginibacter sp.]|nr:hypothetical protein [Mucilaginibacter sp.]
MVSFSELVLKVNSKNNNPVFNLNNVDPEDMDDVLRKIQNSFDIRLVNEDLREVKTFGSLCDTIVEKVKHKNGDGCTTQQAFYKLRNAINATITADKELIKPQTRLSDIFPRDTRLQVIAEIEKEMGFKMNLLKPKGSVVFAFSLILGVSIIGLFFYPAISGVGLIIAAAGLILAGKFGKEMPVKTLGDLAEKIAREHYRNCRRNASTVNRTEVNEKVKALFVHDLYLEPSVLTRDSKFN